MNFKGNAVKREKTQGIALPEIIYGARIKLPNELKKEIKENIMYYYSDIKDIFRQSNTFFISGKKIICLEKDNYFINFVFKTRYNRIEIREVKTMTNKEVRDYLKL